MKNLNYYLFNGITFLLNKLIVTKVKGQRALDLVVKGLIELQTYRGYRHQFHLPVRGQRTKSNGRTIKRIYRFNILRNKIYEKTEKKLQKKKY